LKTEFLGYESVFDTNKMSWEHKIYTKSDLVDMNRSKQHIKTFLHELQNEVMYRARRGETSASLSRIEYAHEKKFDYMEELLDRVIAMFPDCRVTYKKNIQFLDARHTIEVNWT